MLSEVVECYEEHKSAFEAWTSGKPVKSWRDDNNVLCIEYQDGQWWHYRMTKHGLEWW